MQQSIFLPFLQTGRRTVDKAFRIAVGDFLGNIHPYRNGLLPTEAPVIYAGIHYVEPWIRDAAFNVWNGASLLAPDAARCTLLSIIEEHEGVLRVGAAANHYWDAIIAVLGFWQHVLYTGDKAFLELAYGVSADTMRFFEATEFDPQDGLFRGLACCMDALSALPDELAYPVRNRDDYGGARGCRRLFSPADCPPQSRGIPFKTLSTNCLYYQAYRILARMARLRDPEASGDWAAKAARLKSAIQEQFWIKDKQYYAYLVGSPLGPGRCDHQEALGHGFAILFDIADCHQKQQLFAHQHLTPAGLPYLWPTFPRYRDPRYGAHAYGRASGTVWPHAQVFWAQAALRNGRPDLFEREFMLMAEHAERDAHFAEVLHPETGEIYGGVQEVHFTSKPRQTWCATGFIRLVLQGLLGMEFTLAGLRFHPWRPDGFERLTLSNLRYRDADLTIDVHGQGSSIRTCRLNGAEATPFLPAAASGPQHVEIELA